MSRGKAITLGIFTAWPFVYVVLFMCMMFGMVMPGLWGGRPWGAPPAFGIIFPLHLLTMFEIPALLVIYIVYLFRTSRVAQDKKVLWAVVLFLGHMIAMPVFWYLYIWKEPKEGAAGG
ncbi:MAG: hypothetical protein ACYTE3_20200 [Planctomycetota bacterium]|jgi:hypothetical protein